MALKAFYSYIIALVATLFCAWILIPVAHKIGLTDKPGGRKQHQHNTPLIGGIAIFFGFCFAASTLLISIHYYRVLFATAGLLLLEGVTDDFVDIHSKLRFLIQIFVAALIVYWGGVAIHSFGYSSEFGELNLGIWAGPLTIIIIVGYINAMNMLDGQDGLAGCVALAQLIVLAILAIIIGATLMATLVCLLIFAVLGFLLLNFPFPGRKHAVIFLGDAGSMLLALMIAYMAVHLSQERGFVNHFSPAIMAWVLAYPVFDLLTVSLARVLKGKSPMKPGRDHMHHVLGRLGLTKMQSTLVLAFVSIMFGLLGILFWYVHVNLVFYLLLFVLAGILYALAYFILNKKAKLKSLQ